MWEYDYAYLQHSFSKKAGKKFKYISKKLGNTGKYIYTYASDKKIISRKKKVESPKTGENQEESLLEKAIKTFIMR